MIRPFACSLVLCLFSALLATAQAPPIVAQYWPSYGAQSTGQIPWSTMSIAYYFVAATTTTSFQQPTGQDLTNMQAFVAGARANGVRPVFTVGGWTGGMYFSNIVSTPAGQMSFATDLAAFATKYEFDGIDIDWEYPNADGIGCNARSPNDAANFLAFVKVLRNQLGPSALLTAAVGTTGIMGPSGGPLGDYSEFKNYLSYINLMTYDISGPWSATTGPNSPLATCGADSSVQAAVGVWTAGGFPASQILLGIPAYGHSFTTTSSTLVNTTVNGFQSQLYQQKSSTTPQGDATDTISTAGTDSCGHYGAGGTYSGNWQYNNLISGGVLSADGLSGMGGYHRFWDECTSTPFLFNSATRGFIAYDDAQSSAAKAAYAKSQGLAGVMIFDSTGFTQNVYSAIKTSLVSGTAPPAPPSSHQLYMRFLKRMH